MDEAARGGGDLLCSLIALCACEGFFLRVLAAFAALPQAHKPGLVPVYPDQLGCQLLSNNNLILGVQNTGTFPCYCVYCVYCYFLSNRVIIEPLLRVV